MVIIIPTKYTYYFPRCWELNNLEDLPLVHHQRLDPLPTTALSTIVVANWKFSLVLNLEPMRTFQWHRKALVKPS